MKLRILLADDDPALRRVLQFKLQHHGYSTTAVEDGQRAILTLEKEEFDILLTDMKMPGLSGLELLERAKRIRPQVEVILITAYATVSQAVEAMKKGAFDYLTKPFDDDELLMTIEKAARLRKLEVENRRLRDELSQRQNAPEIVGISAAFKQVLSLAEKVAPTDASILITGESGTGKEVIAHLIHQKSQRRDASFVAVNCAAIPKDLLESELFGHSKGAFTGAVKDKKGKFELAGGGTLLLDEISELGYELQAKLLRTLQDHCIEPLGSEKKIEVDIRLIAATNRNLSEQVANGAFREDLFYRLNVIPITMPPLRDRKDDIPALAKAFLSQFCQGEALSLDEELLAKLCLYPWPGNVRELRNLMERMVILRKSPTLTIEDLPLEFRSDKQTAKESVQTPSGYSELSFHEAEKKLVQDALTRSSGNKSKAAAILKIPRHILIYRMKKYDLF